MNLRYMTIENPEDSNRAFGCQICEHTFKGIGGVRRHASTLLKSTKTLGGSHRERVRNMATDTTPTPTKISKQSNSDNTDEAKTTTDLPEGNGRKKKKRKKLGRSYGHQANADSPEGSGEKKNKKARTILWTPSEDNCRLTGRERRKKKKKRKEELGRSSGRQRNPVVTLTMTSMLDEIPASIHLRDPEIESDHLPPTNKAH